ncbi:MULTISPECIES: exodeoxyribonuclease V subunit beta [unclassified Legionella]|uniref:UvrD-helicase domain-containing protein n=1 Tax=unclassified Legionella TaxID=2622702 RepID=UPI001054E6F6|nr:MULTISPECIES: UvrD-helicase domain-containing protein [unclassified Legionella]MDI9819157.1 UvrD-helicase domain-containing protein [Legionella sp. PL877]
MLKDSQQRLQATDPRHSYIVQAPAGSGKTEMLTQRYLRLLGTVNAPEQIIALTFTRKAASEMRERIFLALQQTANNMTPDSPHLQLTYQYASGALARSEQLNWQLLKQPGRLRIMTIDSLCQTISQAIPLQEKQIAYAQIADNPKTHYEAAAYNCLNHAQSDENLHQPLRQLLQHLDNRQDKLLQLFSSLLANRDQWLTWLYFAREQGKTNFEEMLRLIEEHELTRFKQTIPAGCKEELCFLSRQLADIEANPRSPRYPLREWHSFEQLNRELTTSLASLLLTSENQLRKSFDHHVGLKRDACDKSTYENLKSASKELLGRLALASDFLEALVKVKNLPLPSYNEEQWQTLQSLFTLLPLLVAHLHLVFQENNEVDFAAVSQQALLALGDEEQPTDLTLYMDNSINHLLVDEFQDTSIQQFQLLAKLVHGWQPDEGKTLFVVGDPMQSIYRFRQAEVGLFLKAKNEGIGPVRLEFLELCCNFRSTATLVNWVNQQFNSIFPALDDIESGAISYHPAVNQLPADENSYIKACQFSDREKEAAAIIKQIKEELEHYPQDQIAILVRSRNQLTEITRLLREENIPFQGIEIELLSSLPHLRDLWILTQALLMPANRLAWLALLRSPFCGLSLTDLHLLANFNRKQSIYQALAHLDKLALSEEGSLRARFVYETLKYALACRHQQSTVDWIASVFKSLHGEKILTADKKSDLEQFWLLLERFTKKGQLLDVKLFEKEFNLLYSQRSTPSRLQVMTIHKSKGLEFDCVILPGLSTTSKNNDSPLLRWLKLPSQKGDNLLLVSPIKAAHHEQCLLYNYISKLDSEKEDYELQRLLYVAVTRAKKRLWLFDCKTKESRRSFRSLLKKQDFSIIEEAEKDKQPLHFIPSLYKLAKQFYLESPTADDQTPALIKMVHPTNARQIGVVAHELLQWLCEKHPETVEDIPWTMINHRFKSLGFDKQETEQACEILQQQIRKLFEDPIGRWLSSAHEEEQNEYALLIEEHGMTSTRIIDRTFLHNNQRWIIDFKTGNEGEIAQKQHRQQVNDYAKLFTNFSKHPICCGLYYLATGHWVQWDYTGCNHAETLDLLSQSSQN